jgi:hypothetical protein
MDSWLRVKFPTSDGLDLNNALPITLCNMGQCWGAGEELLNPSLLLFPFCDIVIIKVLVVGDTELL